MTNVLTIPNPFVEALQAMDREAAESRERLARATAVFTAAAPAAGDALARRAALTALWIAIADRAANRANDELEAKLKRLDVLMKRRLRRAQRPTDIYLTLLATLLDWAMPETPLRHEILSETTAMLQNLPRAAWRDLTTYNGPLVFAAYRGDRALARLVFEVATAHWGPAAT
jgi:hypothetical protein